ncbi:MAG: hypothetical protein AAF467_27695 [Actinomycetota bacterium]
MTTTPAAVDLTRLADDLDNLRDRVDQLAGQARAIADLAAPEPASDDPGNSGIATPQRNVHPIVRGPLAINGEDYTGQQHGELYIDRHGSEYPVDWSTGTRPQPKPGAARITGYDGPDGQGFDIGMQRQGHPTHSATTLWEQNLPLDLNNPANGGYQRVTQRFLFRRLDDAPIRTMKLPGTYGFNQYDWDYVPAGNRHPGNQNFSYRPVLNSDDNPGDELHWSAYMYLGADINTAEVDIDGPVDPRIGTYSTAGVPRKLEIVDRNGPPVLSNVLYEHVTELDAGTPGNADGSVRVLVRPAMSVASFREVFHITGIRFATEGHRRWTRGYAVTMCGGRDESFAPRNPQQATTVRVTDLEYHAR